ncbi:MAG: cutinase family protein [Frankia sp.]
MRVKQWASRKMGWRVTAVMAAVLAIAGAGIMVPGQAFAAGSTSPAAAPAASPMAGCTAQVYFIGARGSGQPYDTRGPFHGVGPQVNKAITVMEGYLHQKKITYQTLPLSYPAVSTNVLNPSLLDFINWSDYQRNHLGKFIGSINTGLKQATGDAELVRALCPHSKLILVGFSQGAMVMHQTELWLKAHAPTAFRAIVGTVLIADGNRQGNTKAHQFGSSPANGSGIQTWVTNTLRRGPHFADVPLPASTANICNNSDLVCDTSLGALRHFSNSASIHANSYAKCSANNKCTYYPALINGATWVGKLVARKL